jgi:hypothetical protein
MTMTTNMPPEASALGTFIAEYDQKTGVKVLSLIGSLGLAAHGIGFFLCGITSLLATKDPGETAPIFLGGLFLALPGVLWFIWAIRGTSNRVLIFDDGFAYIKGNKTHIIRWEEVKAVWYTGVKTTGIKTVNSSTIQLKDGRRFSFGKSFANTDQLNIAIQTGIAQHVLPKAEQAYESGERVAFGRLALSKTGISMEGRTLPWDEVGDVTVEQGVVTIRKRGGLFNKWASIQVRQIPNFFAFANLAGVRTNDGHFLWNL